MMLGGGVLYKNGISVFCVLQQVDEKDLQYHAKGKLS